MATEFIDPDGRHHWAEEESNFAKSGLESGHLRRASEPVSEKVDETDGEQGDAEKVDETDGEQGDAEKVDETDGEADDAAVEQDGDGADAVGDTDGSSDAQPARRGSRKR
jgi:hypothetical protein